MTKTMGTFGSPGNYDIICEDVVYLPGEKLSLFTNFCSNQRFS